MNERHQNLPIPDSGSLPDRKKKKKKKGISLRQPPTEWLERLQDGPGVTRFEKTVHRLVSNFDEFVLFEDDGLLIVNKPPGIYTQGAAAGQIDMVDVCRFVHGGTASPVNRLDRDTSGVVIFGKTKKARHDMSVQFENKGASGVQKTYLALLDGVFESGNLVRADVMVDDSLERVHVVPSKNNNSKMTATEFEPVVLFHPADNAYRQNTLTNIKLITGKRHQIRVVAADHLGMPIVGDRLYNPDPSGAARQLLHSHTLIFHHPDTGEEMLQKAALPADFTQVLNTMAVAEVY